MKWSPSALQNLQLIHSTDDVHAGQIDVGQIDVGQIEVNQIQLQTLCEVCLGLPCAPGSPTPTN